eukprot:Sdes_comp17239_c0_seq2m6429
MGLGGFGYLIAAAIVCLVSIAASLTLHLASLGYGSGSVYGFPLTMELRLWAVYCKLDFEKFSNVTEESLRLSGLPIISSHLDSPSSSNLFVHARNISITQSLMLISSNSSEISYLFHGVLLWLDLDSQFTYPAFLGGETHAVYTWSYHAL